MKHHRSFYDYLVDRCRESEVFADFIVVIGIGLMILIMII